MTEHAVEHVTRRPVSDTTFAQRLNADPRVERARHLLMAAVADAGGAIPGPRPRIASRVADYQQTLERFAEMRGGKLFYPYLGSGVGWGPLVELDDGSIKYDMITGIGVHFFGHSHPGLIDACVRAAMSDTVMAGNLQQNTDSVALSESLLALANRPTQGDRRLTHAFLTSSGAMANENALKLALHRHRPADRVLALEHCFCGRTLAMSTLTDKPAYRVGLPPALAVDYIPLHDAALPDGDTARALNALRKLLARYPGRYAAMKFELVSGEGGFYPGSADYFRTLMTELKSQGVAVIVDEVQTFGRTPAPFAFQHFGLDDLVDIVTIGKLSQVCATLFTTDYKPGPGLLSQTFTSSAAAIAAARWIIDQLSDGQLYGPDGRIEQVHARFAEHFDAIAQEHPGLIEGPYGLGGMIACTPLGGDPAKVKALLQRLFELGVIAFLAGGSPARLRFLPPVPVTSDATIDAVCAVLRRALADVAGGAH